MDMMKIMGSKRFNAIPMGLLLPYERQALRNHGQSLHRLNERGGLSVLEALWIIEGHKWKGRAACPDDEEVLLKLAAEYKDE